jgi:hypothetical protein
LSLYVSKGSFGEVNLHQLAVVDDQVLFYLTFGHHFFELKKIGFSHVTGKGPAKDLVTDQDREYDRIDPIYAERCPFFGAWFGSSPPPGLLGIRGCLFSFLLLLSCDILFDGIPAN